MESAEVIEKLEQLASQAEREMMGANTMHLRSIQLRGYVEGLRDAMKVMGADSDKL
jgi:hypothetical protein